MRVKYFNPTSYYSINIIIFYKNSHNENDHRYIQKNKTKINV